MNAVGESYFKENRFEEAREQFEKCIGINKVFAEPHINLGKTLFALKRYEEAIERYSWALQMRLTSAQESVCFYNLGLANKAI
jgi:tetratricopeptide (TPR) repeat protein